MKVIFSIAGLSPHEESGVEVEHSVACMAIGVTERKEYACSSILMMIVTCG